MDIIADSANVSNARRPHDKRNFARSSALETLDVETVPTRSLLPTERKWGIRFDASGTATLVLGMRDCARGRYTAYFAGLMAVRLGLPFHRVRVYYSATLPAVSQMPQPSGIQLLDSDPPPVVGAIRDLIEDMCGRVTEKGRLAFGANAGVDAADVGFDQQSGRFFMLDRGHSSSILEIAAAHLRRQKHRYAPAPVRDDFLKGPAQ